MRPLMRLVLLTLVWMLVVSGIGRSRAVVRGYARGS